MKNDELMNRRRFFKKAAKGLLPMLGAFVIGLSIMMSAMTSCDKCDGCEASCQDNCETTCSGGCSTGCSSTCKGECSTTCTGGCSTGCSGKHQVPAVVGRESQAVWLGEPPERQLGSRFPNR